MLAVEIKSYNNKSILQDKKGNPIPISALDIIFHKVLEVVSNRKKKIIGKNTVIEGKNYLYRSIIWGFTSQKNKK